MYSLYFILIHIFFSMKYMFMSQDTFKFFHFIYVHVSYVHINKETVYYGNLFRLPRNNT